MHRRVSDLQFLTKFVGEMEERVHTHAAQSVNFSVVHSPNGPSLPPQLTGLPSEHPAEAHCTQRNSSSKQTSLQEPGSLNLLPSAASAQ